MSGYEIIRTSADWSKFHPDNQDKLSLAAKVYISRLVQSCRHFAP